MLYLGAVVGGIGAGAVYGACVGNALKWFPDRRGLAAGITAMGFGAGSALTVFPIANMIKSQGYETTFFKFGIAQGAVVFLVSWFLRAPDARPTRARAPRRCAGRPRFATRVHADRDAAHAGVLGDVRHVRADGDRRTHRHRAADADRQGLRHLRFAGVAVRRDAARACRSRCR